MTVKDGQEEPFDDLKGGPSPGPFEYRFASACQRPLDRQTTVYGGNAEAWRPDK